MKNTLAIALLTASVAACTTASEPDQLGEATQGLAISPVASAESVAQDTEVKLKVGNWDLLQIEITMEPGDVIPWHYHYGLTDVIVTQGTSSHQHPDGTFEDFATGTGFIETTCAVHQIVNRGTTTSKIAVHFVKPHGSAPLTFVSGPNAKVSDPLCHYPGGN